MAKKTYIRTPKFPQPAFDKALPECKADKSWTTFGLGLFLILLNHPNLSRPACSKKFENRRAASSFDER